MIISITRRLAGQFIISASLAGGLIMPVWAGTINATAISKSGAVVSDVVLFATPIGHPVPAAGKIDTAVIAQQQMQFTPFVSVIRVGTDIKFPNYDKVEHHIKSFSPAKEFEIKPYQKGTPAPVLFDKTGIVVIYCLLHDWMRAYVMVVDTPYFGKTDDSGAYTLDNLPAGKYEVRAWHPDMGSIKPALVQTVDVAATGRQELKFNFDFNPKKRRMPKMDGMGDDK